jgi:hypothetical protein
LHIAAKSIHALLRGARQIPGKRIDIRRTPAQGRRTQSPENPVAHFLGGAPCECQRQDAFRGIDHAQKTQIALRQQRGFAGPGRRLHQNRSQ